LGDQLRDKIGKRVARTMETCFISQEISMMMIESSAEYRMNYVLIPTHIHIVIGL
jgi:hypothetical protein